MKLYFDNAAAEPVSAEIFQKLQQYFAEAWANQEAAGYAGNVAAEQEKLAAVTLLNAVSCGKRTDHSVLWGHAGTEVIQAVFRLLTMQYKRGTVLYTAGDHAAVRAAIGEMGAAFTGIELPLTRSGCVDMAVLKSCIQEKKDDIIAVCVPFIISETGAVQDLIGVRRILNDCGSKALLFCDGIQGIGKIPLDWAGIDPDFFTISGQKIGLPAGAALLYRRDFTRYAARLRTELHQITRVPVPFIRLLAERVEVLLNGLPERYETMRGQRKRFCKILSEIVGEQKYLVTIPEKESSPHIIHLLLKNGVQGAIIVRALTAAGISISYGSACDAETNRPSGVLLSMGYSRQESYGALRISFSGEVKECDFLHFAEKLLKTIEEY